MKNLFAGYKINFMILLSKINELIIYIFNFINYNCNNILKISYESIDHNIFKALAFSKCFSKCLSNNC